jgi:O-antigen ligase
MARSVDRLGMLLIVIGAALSRRMVRIEGVALSGDRLLGIAAVIAVAALLVRGRLRFSPIHWALALFVGTQVATTLANVHAWPRGARLVMVYVLGFGCFTLTAHLAASADVRRFTGRAWVVVGAVAGGLGTALAFAANLLHIRLPGTSRVALDGDDAAPLAFAAVLAFYERNIYGSFLIVPFALALWRLGAPGRGLAPGARRALGWLVPIATGVVFSFTRAAWLAMGAIALWWAAQVRLPRRVLWAAAGFVVGLGCVYVVVVGPPAMWQKTVGFFATGRDPSMTTRARIQQVALRSWQKRPILGNGAGSLAAEAVPPDIPAPSLWVGNAEIHILHDSGLLGLGAFVVLVAVTWREVRRRRARGRDEGWDTRGAPLAAASLGVLFACQFTHVLWVMYPYVLLGLLASEVAPPRAPGARTPGSAAP